MSDEVLEASSHDVERIRDIIFGTQMRDYQQRFAVLQQDLARLRQEVEHLSARLAEQDASQDKKVEVLRQEMRQATEGLQNELRETAQSLGAAKVERTDLGQLLLKVGNHLTEGKPLRDLFEDPAEGKQDI
jgi:predicted  nucleic acid-binding Zn-ribbon protein